MEKILQKYASLTVGTGANIQENDYVVVRSPIECSDFARQIAEEAYKKGAKNVTIHWSDEKFLKLKLTHSSLEALEEYPDWQVEQTMYYARKGAAFISIAASDPENLKGVDPEKIGVAQKTAQLANKEFSSYLMNNKCPWTIVSVPTVGWAKKVFPDLSIEDAIAKLWENIFKIVRVDQEDPNAAWKKHLSNLKEKTSYLNSTTIKELHYKSANGTDLSIQLPENYAWLGADEKTVDGRYFVANMPTEEVFTLPLKTGVNGVVFSSKPLNYGGTLIDNFSITFKDGKIVDYTAKEGYDALKNIIETDEGSHYLGEVALVPFHSPISDSNIVFYNTLYDENASCHLAIGRAYPCFKDAEEISQEEISRRGANDSLTHVDFMIGTSDLDIVGITENNEKVQIFKNGDWAF